MRRFFGPVASIGVFFVATCAASLGGQPQHAQQKFASLKDIKENFLKYEGRTVALVGFLKGSHVGTFIESEDHTDLIRIRFAEQLPTKRVRVVRDAVYKDFAAAANSLYAPAIQPNPIAAIEVIGVISVLRRGRELAMSYDPYREAPVEFVPTQVLRFERLSRPSVEK
jgi:hypothetical protein